MSREHTSHEIQPTQSKYELSKGDVSRRSFIRLAVGALTSLPAVTGGVLVGAPAVALAEEAAQGEDGIKAMADAMSSGVITVMAVRYDEVCVSALDITDGRKNAKPVADAKVKITSYYNKRSVEATTNKDGLVVVRVGDLAEDEPKKENICTFSAYIEMSAPGYRIFKTGRATLTGGGGLELATMKLEEGVPYPSRVTFADWDILYTNHGFCSVASNDLNHKIQVELEDVAPWRQLTVKFMDKEDRVYAEGTVLPTSGHVTVSIAHKYLQRKDGNRYALPIGGAFLVKFYQDGVEYSVPVSIIVCPPGAKDDGGLIEDTLYKLTPFADVAKNLEFRLPDWMGPLAGTNVRFFPSLTIPMSVAVNPSAGLYGFSINVTGFLASLLRSSEEKEKNKQKWTTFFGYKSQNGNKDADAWKFHGTELHLPDSWGSWDSISKAARETYAKNANSYDTKYKEICDRLGLEPHIFAASSAGSSGNNNNNTLGDDDSLSPQSEREGWALVPTSEEQQLVPMGEEGGSYWDRYFQLSLWINELMRYNYALDLFQVTANFAVNAKFGIAWVLPFTIPVPIPIPGFFSLELSFDITLGGGLYGITPEFWSLSKYTWDPSTQDINLLINPSFTASLGIGVKGFASVALYLAVGAAIKIGYSFKPRNADNKNIPDAAVGKNWHTVVGLSFKGGIYAQCFLIYVEYQWPIKSDPAWIDNWREEEGVSVQGLGAQALVAQEMEELQNMSFGELYDDPRTTSGIVSEDALGELVEFVGNYDYRPPATQGGRITAQNGDIAAQSEGDASGDAIEYVTVEAEDGSTLTVPVIRLNVYDADPEPQKSEAEGQKKEEGADQTVEEQPTENSNEAVTSSSAADPEPQKSEEEGQKKEEGADQTAEEQPTENSNEVAASASAAGLEPDATKPVGIEPLSAESSSEGVALSTAATGGEDVQALIAATATDAEQQPMEGAPQEEPVPATYAEQPVEGAPQAADPEQKSAEAMSQEDGREQKSAEAMSQEDGREQKNEELKPQAAGPVPRPAMFGDYVPVRDQLFAQSEESPGVKALGNDQLFAQSEESPGVKGLGREGGLIPSVDTVFAGDVFSDPRTKVVEIEGTPHVFRLASVKIRVDGREVYRTRVVCQQLDPSAEGIGSQVFDIPNNEDHAFESSINPAGLRREDCFDYDFDVCVEYTPDDEGKDVHGYIHLVVISGERDRDDQPDLATILSRQGFGYAGYKFGGADKVTCSLHTWIWASGNMLGKIEAPGRTVSYQYHTFSCPQITVADPDWRTENFTKGATIVLFAVLDFASNDERAVLNKRGGASSNCDVGYHVFCVTGARGNAAMILPNLVVDDVQDGSIYGMTLSDAFPNTDGMHLLQLFGENETYAILTNPQYIFLLGYAVTKMRRVTFPASDDVDYKTAQLRPWRSGNYLTSIKVKPTSTERQQELGENALETRIYRADLVDGSGNPITSIDQDAKLVFSNLGLDGHGITDFCIHPSGNTIFWPVMREDVPVMREDDNGGLYDTGETESYYAIKASDFWSTNGYADEVTGEFRDPYVFAEVSHRMDTLTLPRSSSLNYELFGLYGPVNFLSSEVLDVTKAKGNVWLTRIPWVNCLTVISIDAVSKLVLPGQDAVVNVGVRNDGNFPIGYFEAQICKTDGTVLFEKELDLLYDGNDPHPLMESKWNPRKDDGTLEDDIYNGWLPPGKCGLYKLTIPIPDDWESRIDIVVRIKSLDVPGENTVSAQGGLRTMAEEVGPITYIEVLKDEPTETLTVSTNCEVTTDILNPAAVTVRRSGDSGSAGAGGNGGSGGNAGSGGESGSNGRTGLPRTADDSRGMGALGIAAAALGSGMVAYSRRRTKLEEGRR